MKKHQKNCVAVLQKIHMMTKFVFSEFSNLHLYRSKYSVYSLNHLTISNRSAEKSIHVLYISVNMMFISIQSKPYKRKCPRRWKLSHDFLRRFHSFYSFLCTFLFPTKIIWKKIILLNLVNHKKIINSRFLFVNLSKSMYTFIMFIWFVSFSIHYLWLVTSKWRCKGLFNADKTVLGAVLSRLPWIIDDSDIQKTWLK